jgi:hypothetical protein
VGLGESESGAVAHLALSGPVVLLLLNRPRPHALRPIYGLLRGLLGRGLTAASAASAAILAAASFLVRAERSSSLGACAT